MVGATRSGPVGTAFSSTKVTTHGPVTE